MLDKKIEIYLNRKVNFPTEVMLGGGGIIEWNVSEPQPSVEELEAIEVVTLQYEINEEAERFLNTTDWKVIRHRDQLAAGLPTSLTSSDYLSLLQERQEKRNLIIK